MGSRYDDGWHGRIDERWSDWMASSELTQREISQKYNRFARWYDWVEGVPEVLGVNRLRKQILQRASGKVLEVAIGTGKNLPCYPSGCRIVAVDASTEMLTIARNRASRLQLKIAFVLADAEALPFSDETFDTIVSSLSTCTFPDPVAALKEMARVCRKMGKVLLLEHGRSDREWLARFQDRTADRHAKKFGCRWNRNSLDLVRQAGLKINKGRQVFFGVFNQIEAAPEPEADLRSSGYQSE
jgi:ubiquinone/menaquinone biosynthesis C-methylase UbiE